MRYTKYFIPTHKEIPAEAEIISHQLMLRAGLIRKLFSGIYTYLPAGLRSIKKVENIIREEMDRSGAVEILMPAVQPAELWQESGRWDYYGSELLRFKDRPTASKHPDAARTAAPKPAVLMNCRRLILAFIAGSYPFFSIRLANWSLPGVRLVRCSVTSLWISLIISKWPFEILYFSEGSWPRW